MTEIFVFGSNLAGRHGKGAALHARNYYGAIYGQGEGLQGNSYAIPTKDKDLNVLAITVIAEGVNRFIEFARDNPNVNFEVTSIGCGLAGYRQEEIKPLFAGSPENVKFTKEWIV